MKPVRSTSIEKLATAIYDNGRRGSPRPGCDCVQCFGYCITDRDKLQRDMNVPLAGVIKPISGVGGWGNLGFGKGEDDR